MLQQHLPGWREITAAALSKPLGSNRVEGVVNVVTGPRALALAPVVPPPGVWGSGVRVPSASPVDLGIPATCLSCVDEDASWPVAGRRGFGPFATTRRGALARGLSAAGRLSVVSVADRTAAG